jgi:hypothetical protein
MLALSEGKVETLPNDKEKASQFILGLRGPKYEKMKTKLANDLLFKTDNYPIDMDSAEDMALHYKDDSASPSAREMTTGSSSFTFVKRDLKTAGVQKQPYSPSTKPAGKQKPTARPSSTRPATPTTKRPVTCHLCDKVGHFMVDCPTKKSFHDFAAKQRTGNINMFTSSSLEDDDFPFGRFTGVTMSRPMTQAECDADIVVSSLDQTCCILGSISTDGTCTCEPRGSPAYASKSPVSPTYSPTSPAYGQESPDTTSNEDVYADMPSLVYNTESDDEEDDVPIYVINNKSIPDQLSGAESSYLFIRCEIKEEHTSDAESNSQVYWIK